MASPDDAGEREPAAEPVVTRVAMISMHTSPLAQPGSGDAGGLNVYVVALARELAARGTKVEIFTRAVSSAHPETVELADGVLVRHVAAGPYEGLTKEELPGQMCAFAAGTLQVGARAPQGWYDLVHSHYWLSGHVGWLAAERWGVPLVHSAHTLAKVKNAHLAAGDAPEPPGRIIGEEQVVAAADALIANTAAEAEDLVERYGADLSTVHVAPPGVDLETFCPGPSEAARRELGLPQDAVVLLFAGRVQPLKGADVLVRAAAHLLRADPSLRERLTVAVVGGASGTGLEPPHDLGRLAASLGLVDGPGARVVVLLAPPAPRAHLARWFRAADVVAVPSHSESFGLVALEAQACGATVVAARVGGLVTAVDDGVSGVLVDGHHPARWADVLRSLLADPGRRAALGAGGRAHAERFGWGATADAVVKAYAAAAADHRREGAAMTQSEPSRPTSAASTSAAPSGSGRPVGTLVLLRHGQSTWNAENLFTGWVDVPLSEDGRAEAVRGGHMLVDAGLLPDVVHTSLLRRAISTANMALGVADRHWIETRRSWRLNERHYGALQGKDKKATLEEYGEEQFMTWRRSYATPPPPIDPDGEFSQSHDVRYAHLGSAAPRTECLEDVVERMLPYWYDAIVPDLRLGRCVLLAAHGNSLRALVKHLDGVSDEDIVGLNIPTGIPLRYDLDEDLAPLTPGGTYLDPDAAAAAAAAVAAQGR